MENDRSDPRMNSPTKSRHFSACAEMTLLELAEFRSLADRFAPRFLRDASIFPFETSDGSTCAGGRRSGRRGGADRRLNSFLGRPLKS